MKVLALIPARGGSKRLPGKNIKLLGGRPLISWTITLAKQIVNLVDVMVSTDDPLIAEAAERAGAFVPWLRPVELATDMTPSIDVVLHALSWYEEKHGKLDGVLLLQPTSPFRRLETVLQGIELFKTNNLNPVIGVSSVSSHPFWCFYSHRGHLKPVIENRSELHLRTQDLPHAYAINGGFYLTSISDLKKNNTFFSEKMMGLIMDKPFEGLDIDTNDDWALAEFAYERLKDIEKT